MEREEKGDERCSEGDPVGELGTVGQERDEDCASKGNAAKKRITIRGAITCTRDYLNGGQVFGLPSANPSPVQAVRQSVRSFSRTLLWET